MVAAPLVERQRQVAHLVVDPEARGDGVVGDGPAEVGGEVAAEAVELGVRVGERALAGHVLGQVEVLDVEVGGVALHDARQVPGDVADRAEDGPGEVLHVATQEELERALGDRAHERLEARVGVHDLDLVAGPEQADRHEPRRVDDLERRIHREHGEPTDARVPLAGERQRLARRELQQVTTLLDGRFHRHGDPPGWSTSAPLPSSSSAPPVPSSGG
jgi:hypothetical protein